MNDTQRAYPWLDNVEFWATDPRGDLIELGRGERSEDRPFRPGRDRYTVVPGHSPRGTCTAAHPDKPFICRLPKHHDGPHAGLHVYDIDKGRRAIAVIRTAKRREADAA